MRTKNHAFYRRAVRRIGVVAFAVGGISLALAITPRITPSSIVAYPVTKTGNVSTLGHLTAGSTAVNALDMVVTPSGAITGTGTASLAMGAAAPLIIDVVATIPKASVAAAIGKFLGKTIPIVNLAANLYDLGNELDYIINTGPPGSSTITYSKFDEVIDCTGSCTVYQFADGQTWGDLGSACASKNGSLNGYTFVYTAGPSENCAGVSTHISSGQSSNFFEAVNSKVVPQTTKKVARPSSATEFVTDVTAKNDWKPDSKLAPVLRDAVKSGETVDLQPTAASGPASQQVSQSTSNDVVNNTTTTTTNNNNYTYSGPNITTNNSETKLTINNTTNEVITNTTTSSSNTTKETDMCALHPESVACTELDVPDGEIPKSQKDVSYQAESIWGTGSCPADKFVTLHTGQVLKVWDFQKTCEAVNAGIAPLLLLGAGYSAFLILSLGVKDGV